MTRRAWFTRRALLSACAAVGLVASTAASAAASSYTPTDLGSLGLGVTVGAAINANGQITGGRIWRPPSRRPAVVDESRIA